MCMTGNYSVSSAAQTYFQKNLSLDIEESPYLGMFKIQVYTIRYEIL
jgi:membrane carboxypeptidase/penicillin-binding protein